MQNLFSIGQMSKLHNISVQTLRYYDKIGLFKPTHTDPGSNYRYYSSDQFIYLEIIKYLKYFGTSLEEIKQIINYHNSVEDLTKILIDKEKSIGEQIQQLMNLRNFIRERIVQLEQTSSTNTLGQVYLKHCQESSACFFDFDGNTPEDYMLGVHRMLSLIEKRYYYFPNCDMGFYSYYHEFLETNDLKYRKVYLVLNPEMVSLADESDITRIPAGDYLCILFKGDQNEASRNYRTLISYIKDHQLAVDDAFYESSLIHGFATTNEQDYIMEIKILLKSC